MTNNAPYGEVLDLGVLRPRRTPGEVSFYAPSPLTRAVWLAGTATCGVFLYSVVLTFGWSTRLPTLSETPFWLLPLLLAALFAALATGGVRVRFTEPELELRTFWPQRGRRVYLWEELRGVSFFKERTRSREQLYGVRLRFAEAEVVLRTADADAWRTLQRRF